MNNLNNSFQGKNFNRFPYEEEENNNKNKSVNSVVVILLLIIIIAIISFLSYIFFIKEDENNGENNNPIVVPKKDDSIKDIKGYWENDTTYINPYLELKFNLPDNFVKTDDEDLKVYEDENIIVHLEIKNHLENSVISMYTEKFNLSAYDYLKLLIEKTEGEITNFEELIEEKEINKINYYIYESTIDNEVSEIYCFKKEDYIVVILIKSVNKTDLINNFSKNNVIF